MYCRWFMVMVVVIKLFETRIRMVNTMLVNVNKYFLRKSFVIHDYYHVHHGPR
jgi:hypothetical protein